MNQIKLDKYSLILTYGFFSLLLVLNTTMVKADLFLDTMEVEIKFAELIYFKPTFGPAVPDDEETYEAVVFGVKVIDMDLWDSLMSRANQPVLRIGQDFTYPIYRILTLVDEERLPIGRIIVFQIKNWAEIQEGEKVFLYVLSSAMMRGEEIKRNHAGFSHDIIIDARWEVYSGNIRDSQGNAVPYVTLKITGENISLTQIANIGGGFSLVKGEGEQREGFFMEANTTYVVEVLANELVLFSQTVTRETAAYPRWEIKLDTTVDYYEIKGFVYDSSGNPLPEVTLTVDEYHTTTTDEKGYYQIPSFFAGSYTLVASKEGYHFSPVEFTVGEGQPPVTIDLVEERPNTMSFIRGP
jgi:hypothetical protein